MKKQIKTITNLYHNGYNLKFILNKEFAFISQEACFGGKSKRKPDYVAVML